MRHPRSNTAMKRSAWIVLYHVDPGREEMGSVWGGVTVDIGFGWEEGSKRGKRLPYVTRVLLWQ